MGINARISGGTGGLVMKGRTAEVAANQAEFGRKTLQRFASHEAHEAKAKKGSHVLPTSALSSPSSTSLPAGGAEGVMGTTTDFFDVNEGGETTTHTPATTTSDPFAATIDKDLSPSRGPSLDPHDVLTEAAILVELHKQHRISPKKEERASTATGGGAVQATPSMLSTSVEMATVNATVERKRKGEGKGSTKGEATEKKAEEKRKDMDEATMLVKWHDQTDSIEVTHAPWNTPTTPTTPATTATTASSSPGNPNTQGETQHHHHHHHHHHHLQTETGAGIDAEGKEGDAVYSLQQSGNDASVSSALSSGDEDISVSSVLSSVEEVV